MKPLTLSFQLEGFLPYPTAGIVVYLPLGSNFQMFFTAVFSFAFMSFTSPFCLIVPWAGHGFFSVVKLCWIWRLFCLQASFHFLVMSLFFSTLLLDFLFVPLKLAINGTWEVSTQVCSWHPVWQKRTCSVKDRATAHAKIRLYDILALSPLAECQTFLTC